MERLRQLLRQPASGREVAAAGMLPKIKALINVDMIGDNNLDIVQD